MDDLYNKKKHMKLMIFELYPSIFHIALYFSESLINLYKNMRYLCAIKNITKANIWSSNIFGESSIDVRPKFKFVQRRFVDNRKLFDEDDASGADCSMPRSRHTSYCQILVEKLFVIEWKQRHQENCENTKYVNATAHIFIKNGQFVFLFMFEVIFTL